MFSCVSFPTHLGAQVHTPGGTSRNHSIPEREKEKERIKREKKGGLKLIDRQKKEAKGTAIEESEGEIDRNTQLL